MKKRKFEDVFYKGFLIFSMILSGLFLFFSWYLNKDFFLRFSMDKKLTETVANSVHYFNVFLLILGIVFLILILILIYFKKRFKMFVRKHASLFQNLLLLIGMIIFLIIIGEITANILLKQEVVLYGLSLEGIKFAPEFIELNQDGMKDRDFEIQKPRNTIRIAVLGDSFTFGSRIDDADKIYPKVLEKKINERKTYKKYEVLNFALPGIETDEELELLKTKALKYDPDILIIGFYPNDIRNIDPEIKSYKRFSLPYVGFWLRDCSYLYYFVETRINKILENLNYIANYEETLMQAVNSDINKNYSKELFKNISKIAKENGMEVLIVNFPIIYNFDNYPLLTTNEFIQGIAEENEFCLVDMFEIYKEYDESELVISKYNAHHNDLGHELTAEAILSELIRIGVIT